MMSDLQEKIHDIKQKSCDEGDGESDESDEMVLRDAMDERDEGK